MVSWSTRFYRSQHSNDPQANLHMHSYSHAESISGVVRLDSFSESVWIRETRMNIWCDERHENKYNRRRYCTSPPLKSASWNDKYSPYSWRDASIMRWRLCVASHLVLVCVWKRAQHLRGQMHSHKTNYGHHHQKQYELNALAVWSLAAVGKAEECVLHRCTIQFFTPVFFLNSTANKIALVAIDHRMMQTKWRQTR